MVPIGMLYINNEYEQTKENTSYVYRFDRIECKEITNLMYNMIGSITTVS